MIVSLAPSVFCLENVPKYEETRGEGDEEEGASWSGLASMPGLYWGIGLGLAAITVIVDFSCLFLKKVVVSNPGPSVFLSQFRGIVFPILDFFLSRYQAILYCCPVLDISYSCLHCERLLLSYSYKGVLSCIGLSYFSLD